MEPDLNEEQLAAAAAAEAAAAAARAAEAAAAAEFRPIAQALTQRVQQLEAALQQQGAAAGAAIANAQTLAQQAAQQAAAAAAQAAAQQQQQGAGGTQPPAGLGAAGAADAVPTLANAPRVQLPSPFNPTENPDSYMYTWQQLGRLVNIPPPLLWPTFASRQVGVVATWAQAHQAHCEREGRPLPDTFEALADVFLERYRPVDARIDAQRRLDKLKQRTSVSKYTVEFDNVVLLLPSLDEHTRVHTYLRGLKPGVQHGVVSSGYPETLQEAKKRALALDELTYRFFSRPNTSSHGATPMDLGAINSNNTRREDDFRNGLCFTCHKAGHRAANCPMKKKNKTGGKSGGGGGNAADKTPKN